MIIVNNEIIKQQFPQTRFPLVALMLMETVLCRFWVWHFWFPGLCWTFVRFDTWLVPNEAELLSHACLTRANGDEQKGSFIFVYAWTEEQNEVTTTPEGLAFFWVNWTVLSCCSTFVLLSNTFVVGIKTILIIYFLWGLYICDSLFIVFVKGFCLQICTTSYIIINK